MGDKERDDDGSDCNPGKDLPRLDYDPHKKSYDDGSTRDHGEGSQEQGDHDDHRSGKE